MCSSEAFYWLADMGNRVEQSDDQRVEVKIYTQGITKLEEEAGPGLAPCLLDCERP
jgi:hypothetical protein